MKKQEGPYLILFDGVCNLCNQAVDFIIRRDRQKLFKFAALQDPSVKPILDKFGINNEYLDSLILIKGAEIYFRSRAALEIAKKLQQPWPLWYAGIVVPSGIRDFFYDWIAKFRYRIFGKKNTCRIPNEEEKSKFWTMENTNRYLQEQ